MARYANEYLGVCDIDRVKSPVTKQNVEDAFDQLMFIKVVSMLLANQDGNAKDLEVNRLMDLGRLFFFLADHPSDVLGELSAAFNDDDDGPHPGKEKPILTSIEATNNQAVGAAK
jgi:hypothetical protein